MSMSSGTGVAARSDGILRAVATAARRFARTDSWENVIKEVLHLIGFAAEVSRVYVFENSAPAGFLVYSIRYEWCRIGLSPTIYAPDNQNCPYRPKFARWERLLGGGSTISGVVRQFPDIEKPDLEAEDVLSIAVVPIFAGDDWWGFMGFDDCKEERQWTDVELDALQAAAETLGGAILRQRTEQRLHAAEDEIRKLTGA